MGGDAGESIGLASAACYIYVLMHDDNSECLMRWSKDGLMEPTCIFCQPNRGFDPLGELKN